MQEHKPNGITLMEVLIIGAIVGIMGILASVALDTARERARDAKRFADISRVQATLELYFNDFNTYPVEDEPIALGQINTAELCADGFSAACTASGDASVYMSPVVSPPKDGLKELVSCSGQENVYCYQGNDESYRIEFEVENNNEDAGIQKGVNCAMETGIIPGACSSLE